jgi:hypothetical protein
VHAFSSNPCAPIPSPSLSPPDHDGPSYDAREVRSRRNSYDDTVSPGSAQPTLTFLDGEQRTAHSIGLAGEQDLNLLSSLRSIIVNERDTVDAGVFQAFPGDPTSGEPPVHFNILNDDLPRQDIISTRETSDAIENIVGEHGPRLVSIYFKYIHPMNCVISKGRFLRAYYTKRLSLPASLRGAVYGLGAMSWTRDPQCASFSTPNYSFLFQKAHYALHMEYHAPNQWTLQASLLLLHERPGDSFTIETPRTWILSTQAAATAQVLGLHRDPQLWNLAPWEKRIRRKLWWAAYMANTWASVCHGNPPHISRDSFTTAPILIDEIAQDEEIEEELLEFLDRPCSSAGVTASARFIESVKLSRILHELLESF